MRYLFFFLLLVTACAPSLSKERLNVTPITGPRDFYPSQAGLKWDYLEPGEDVDAPRFTKEVMGKTRVDGKILTVSRFYGRGYNATLFEDYTDAGVFLYREDRGENVVIYTPGYQVLPPPSDLAVGEVWGGTTTATIYSPRDATTETTTTYRYTVVDRRSLVLGSRFGGKPFDVYVISLETFEDVDGQTQRSNSELFYVPYVGNIKTPQALYLVDTNFNLPVPQ